MEGWTKKLQKMFFLQLSGMNIKLSFRGDEFHEMNINTLVILSESNCYQWADKMIIRQ